MEVYLTQQCLSLTGSLGRGYGYFIVGRWSKKDVKYRFYSQRSKHSVPPDGHWRFIALCAELAQNRLHISDIRVKPDELQQALDEAGFTDVRFVRKEYNARDILFLKKLWNL